MRTADKSVALDIDLGFRNPAETLEIRKTRKLTERPGRSFRVTARQTPRDLLSASISLVNPLVIWEEPTCAARHGWRDRRTAARRALSVSQRVHLFLPPPSSLAGGVTRSRDHWVRLDSRALAYVRSIDQSVGRSRFPPTGKYFADRRSRDCASTHSKHTYTQIRARESSHVSGFSSGLDINRLTSFMRVVELL